MQDENIAPAGSKTSLEPGTTLLARYKIISHLASGAQASVSLCEDLHMSRQVALKVLAWNSDESVAERFKREARILAGLSHPNIVKIYAAGNLDDGSSFLAMEYVQGKTLAEILQSNVRLSAEEILVISSQLLHALEYLHSNAVLHRDIKPANILIRKIHATADPEAKLLDFGIAKIYEGEETQSSGTATKSVGHLGTPSYMSPEQCQSKKLSPPSDLYSLACVMYEAASGTAPFAGLSAMDIMYKQTTESLAPLDGFPEKLAEVIHKALEKDPANRYGSAREMLAALPQASELDTVKLTKAKIPEGSGRSSRNKLLLASVLILVCAITALSFWTHTKRSNTADNQLLNPTASGRKLVEGIESRSCDERYKICKRVLTLDPKINKEARKAAFMFMSKLILAREGPDKELEYARMWVAEASDPKHPDLNSLNSAYLQLAQAYLDNNNPKAAMQTWEKLTKILESWDGPEDVSIAKSDGFIQRAYYFNTIGKPEQVENSARLALAALNKFNDHSSTDYQYKLIDVYYYIASSLLVRGKIAEAKVFIDKLGKIPNYPQELLSKYAELSHVCIYNPQAHKLGKQLLEKAEKTQKGLPVLPAQEWRIYLAKAEMASCLGDKIAKQKAFKKALSFIDKLKKSEQSSYLYSLGTTAMSMGDTQLSESCLLKAVELAGTNAPENNYGCLSSINLCYIYCGKNQLEKALKYSDLALNYCRKIAPWDYALLKQAIVNRFELNKKLKKEHENGALATELEQRMGATP